MADFEYVSQDEYRQWQAQKFRRQAEAKAFRPLADQLIENRKRQAQEERLRRLEEATAPKPTPVGYTPAPTVLPTPGITAGQVSPTIPSGVKPPTYLREVPVGATVRPEQFGTFYREPEPYRPMPEVTEAFYPSWLPQPVRAGLAGLYRFGEEQEEWTRGQVLAGMEKKDPLALLLVGLSVYPGAGGAGKAAKPGAKLAEMAWEAMTPEYRSTLLKQLGLAADLAGKAWNELKPGVRTALARGAGRGGVAEAIVVSKEAAPTFEQRMTELGRRGVEKVVPRVSAEISPKAAKTSLDLLNQALAEQAVPLGRRITDFWDTSVRSLYDRNFNLHTLENATGIPVHKIAQVASGATAAGEDLIRRFVQPVFRGVNARDLERYMVLRRAEDVLALNPSAKLPGGMAGWGDVINALQGLKTKLGPVKFAQIEEAAKKIYQLDDELILKPKLEAGILSREGYNAIKADHPHYIDFHRVDFNIEGFAEAMGTPGRRVASIGYSGIDKMAREGSDLLLDQPLARWVAQIVDTQNRVARQKAAVEIVHSLTTLEKQTGTELVKLGETASTQMAAPIWFFQDGKPIAAQVPRVYADIAKGLESQPVGWVIGLFNKLAWPLRAGAITYNPAFLIVNPIRDAVSAMVREGLSPLSRDYIRGWVAALTKNADFSDAAKSGVLMSGIIENFSKTKQLVPGRTLMGIQLNSVADAATYPFRLMEALNIAAERATRIATYVKLKGQGVGELSAAVRARDVTVDFSKSGNFIRVVNQMIPFLNAGIQGAANTVRVMRQNPKQAIIGSLPLVAGTITSWLWNQRFETAKLIPDYEYANNWVFIVGEGEKRLDPEKPGAAPERFPIYVKIPKGPMGALLTAPAELAMRYAWQQDDRSLADLFLATGGTAVQALSPIEPSLAGVLPPAVSTGITTQLGFDPFRGQPIVPQREQRRPPEFQYGPETSKAAVALGQQFKVSPRLIDYAIRDYMAGGGQLGLEILDVGLGALGYTPEAPGKPLQRELAAEEQLTRLPVVTRFLGTRATQQERLGWNKFRQVVDETQRQFSQIPETVELNIFLGEVGEDIRRVPLTLEERAQYQRLALAEIEPLLKKVVADPRFKALKTPELKRKVIQGVMTKGRERAQRQVIRQIGKDEAYRRLRELQPTAQAQ